MIAATDVRSIATWLLGEIERRTAESKLHPFGDGPFELSLSSELSTAFASNWSTLREAFGRAMQLTVSRALGDDPSEASFEILVSLAIVARQLQIGLEGWGVPETLSFLQKQADRFPPAQNAIATLLRSLLRVGESVDVGLLEELCASPSPIVRRAALEAMAKQGSGNLVQFLEQHLATSAEDEQLLWTIAHLDRASLLIAKEMSFRDVAPLLSRFRAALSVLDPSGSAYASWFEKIAKPIDQAPAFEDWDWRLNDNSSVLRKAA